MSARAWWAAAGSVLATQKPSGWLRWRRCSVTSSAKLRSWSAEPVALVHGAVLDGGDPLQAVVGDHPDAGRLLQQDGRIPQDQVVDGVGLLAEDGDRGRGGAGMAKIAGVGVQGGHVGDRLGQAVGRAVVGLAGEQGKSWVPRWRANQASACTPGPKLGRDRGAIDHTTQPAVAPMKSSLLGPLGSGVRPG